MDYLQNILQQYFGKSDFRPGQREVIEALLNQNDVLAIWPTGAGKSLTYQLPALLMPGLTLVISPLISLMQDQVERFNSLTEHLRSSPEAFLAASLNSGASPQDNQLVLEALQRQQLKVLIVAPERLANANFINLLSRIPVSLLVVDEAHCISQWGHDFRPDYLRLGQAVKVTKPQAVLALTATATPEVRRQIKASLGIQKATTFILPPKRANISYQVRHIPPKERRLPLLALLSAQSRQPGVSLVYCGKRAQTEQLAHFLAQHGLDSTYYHAGLSPAERQARQEAFMRGDFQVVTATSAFGMGIDKPDVRLVVHYSPPASLEAYAQESGRAGRDGLASQALVMWDEEDFSFFFSHLNDSYPSQELLNRLYAELSYLSPLEVRGRCATVSPQCWNTCLHALSGPHPSLNSLCPPRLSLETASQYLTSLRQAEEKRLNAMYGYLSGNLCRQQAMQRYFAPNPQEQAQDRSCGRCDNCCA